MSGVPRDQLPEPEPVRFGQAEPYCVRWETRETPDAEFADISPARLRRDAHQAGFPGLVEACHIAAPGEY